jgi:hypothetical protein
MTDEPGAIAASAPATSLTPERIAELRDDMRRETALTGDLVDPRRWRHIETWWRIDLREWAEAILGRAIPEPRRISWRDWVLLDLAHTAEPTPPPPPLLTASRARHYALAEQQERELAERHQAKIDDWKALRAALPVKVVVVHNYTSARHLDGYVQGAEHILLTEELHRGRLHREVGQALCFSPSKARDQRYLSLRDAGDDDRLPSCASCLRTARRLAEKALLTAPHRGGAAQGRPTSRP